MSYRSLATTIITALGLVVSSNLSLSQTTGPVKLGMLVPLTGISAVQGEDMVRGLQLAIERANKGYEVPMKNGTSKLGPGLLGSDVQVIIEDTGDRPATGMEATQKLINVDKVAAVLGTYSSGITIPTAQYARENKKIYMALVTTSPQLRELGEYFFNVMGLDTIAGQQIGQFAIDDSGATKFGTLAMNHPYGVGMEIQSCKAFEEAGAQCVSKVRYEEGQSDYRAELNQLMAAKPEAVMFTAFGTDGRLILRQAYELGLKVDRWYMPYMTAITNEMKDLPEAVEGLKGFFVGSSGEFFESEYAKAYRDKYKEEPTTEFGGYSYDGFMIMMMAIQRAGSTDAEALRVAIPAVAAEYKGVTGDKTMDEQGQQVSEDYQWKVIRNGKAEDFPYQPKPKQ
jgi:branched-chain amino acid transport system substrate-binding protein